jgi:thiosulfate/3-mercaptopyruvate sulfurtransferase
VVLFDCRPDDAKYRAGHVQGALHAHLDRDLASPAPEPARGGRHPLPDVLEFTARLGRWGVTPASHVVAYDDQNGANAASRLWWLLRALGHELVQVVDGGMAALQAAGFAVTSELPVPRGSAPYPASRWQRPLADIEEVERARTDADRRVIDVRAAFRYRGESEPIDPVAGHIPGAHNLPLTENLNTDGSWKSADALRAQYLAALAGVPASQAIVHCGSGVTACHTLLALERAGLAGAKLYVGSWSEWCRNLERARQPAGR